jgi:ABC-2 type transport system ATP-binding protein
LDGVGRRFGSLVAVSAFDLVLRPRDRVALCGPNGSGKTTILRCAAGTVVPTEGRVLVAGHRAGTSAARRAIGVSLSQDRSFYLRLSGRENLLFFAGVRGFSRREAKVLVRKLEQELSLSTILGQRVARCSTGMIQQLSIARALIGDPPILLLDEPTRSLDTAALGRFWEALDRRPDLALLIATHRDQDLLHVDSSIVLAAS